MHVPGPLRSPALTFLSATLILTACSDPERLPCARDLECASGELCWTDGLCLPTGVAQRQPGEVGSECHVENGQDVGCEHGAICVSGFCRGGVTPVAPDAGEAPDSGEVPDSGEAPLCTEGTIADGAPLFGGLTQATVDGADAVLLRWLPAADESPPEDLDYLVFTATVAGAQDFASPAQIVHGVTSARVEGLTTDQTYSFVVRARDPAGQVDCNLHESSATPAAPPSCIDFATMIQPVFNSECITCHSGADAPRGLHLDSYQGALAGGLTGNEVVACQPSSSLLYLKISMPNPPVGERMPRGGPYLPESTIGMIGAWISQGARSACTEPDPCSDTTPPLFAGLSTAELRGDQVSADLCWVPATDDLTAESALVYDVFQATAPGQEVYTAPPAMTSASGASCTTVEGLTPGQEYCWVVRARDGAGNRDVNVEERCLTVPAASCADFTSIVQPIFDNNCIRCHSGANPPRELRLDSYAGVLTGGLTGSEVVACQPSSSLLFLKISMNTPPVGVRMPQDGPPYLTQAQIDAIGQWISEGARLSCSDPGPCSDANPPTFAGLTAATLGADQVSADLCWAAGSDDVTAPGALVYDVFQGTSPGAEVFTAPPALTSGAGASCVNVPGLTPGQEYCWVARARDQAGNRDVNQVERCLTVPAASCADFATVVQPILQNNCVRCHSGVAPPRGLHLDSYGGVLAGGLTGSEVVACQPSSSLLYQKISMASPPVGVRMPQDGPPYLTQAQIDTIGQWISEGARTSCAAPDPCSDTNPPIFGGLATATLGTDQVSARLCWSAGSDDTTAPSALLYDVFQATNPGGQVFGAPPTLTSLPGGSCVAANGLTPGQEYCWVVRARDGAGNRDGNTIERCLTIPAATCAEYAAIVQPIFNANCVRCHSGASAPRGLRLDTYAGVLAGGLTGNEVVACQPNSSLLYMKISMSNPPVGVRMPQDGPPYLTQAQIDTIDQWISEGARASCSAPDPCSDTVPPVFNGLTAATLGADQVSAQLCWNPGSDNVTATGALLYDLFQATAPGGQTFGAPPVVTSPAGATCAQVSGLSPGQEYCWVARARDGAGNRDQNQVERCLTIPAASCADFGSIIQPIFNNNCVRCHSGPGAPRGLHLDSYAGVLAGGLTGGEVVACQPGSSLLYQKISMATPPVGVRMPQDGPPYLPQAQIDLIGQWITEGARSSCAAPDPCSDALPPVFGGLTTATALDATRAQLCWSAASDDLTAPGAIVYDLYEATVSGGQDFGRARATSAAGATCQTVDALSPGGTYCYVVRARDGAGNRDGNLVERCVTMPAQPAGCVDYATTIQPLLDRNCTRCHAGDSAPQRLRLDSYANVLAGSVRRNEVVACQSAASLIVSKIGPSPSIGRRMPRDGPPYLTAAQQSLVAQWINTGARATCSDPSPCGDTSAPTFAGVTAVSTPDSTHFQVCWGQANDDRTPTSAIRYDLYEASSAGGQNFAQPAQTTVTGVTCTQIPAGPSAQVCFVVRARDQAGNVDNNRVEVCATTPAAACAVEYDAMVRPIFAARCTHCHEGDNPPRYLSLTSYGGTLAGGVLRREAVACDWNGSMLRQKTAGAVCGRRMPFDGPPYLGPSEMSVLQRWVESGARERCADPSNCGDTTPPNFNGITSATALDPTTIEVCWSAASDATAPTSALTYDIFEANSPGGQRYNRPANYSAPAGSTCRSIAVPPGQQYCYVVRARDPALNRSTNTNELCVTTPGACLPYEERTQPIFNARCVQCHSGANPPRGIRWDSYAHAVGNSGEVRPCRANNSDLVDITQQCDMPRDTASGFCSIVACLSPAQLDTLSEWVDQGAHQSCPNAGCGP